MGGYFNSFQDVDTAEINNLSYLDLSYQTQKFDITCIMCGHYVNFYLGSDKFGLD